MLIAISVPDHKDRERMGEGGAILQLLHCSTFWDMISPNFISIPVKKKNQSKAARGSTHWYLGVWYGVLHGTCDAIPTCRGVSLSLLREDGWWCGQGLHGQGPGPRGKLLGPNGGSFEGSIFWRLMWYRDTKKMVPGGNHYVRLHVWRELSCSWPYLSMSGTWLERSGNFMSFFVHT